MVVSGKDVSTGLSGHRPKTAPAAGLREGARPGNSLSPRQRETRKNRELELYLRGVPIREIAFDVGLSPQVVIKDLADFRNDFHREQQMSRVHRIAFELAKIDNLERTYWEAWERSLQDQIRSVTSREDMPVDPPKGAKPAGMDANGDPLPPAMVVLSKTKVQRRVDQSIGNPTFLAGIQWCIDRRVKLLGLDEPIKIDVSAQVRRIADEMDLDVQFVESQMGMVKKEWQQQKALAVTGAEKLDARE